MYCRASSTYVCLWVPISARNCGCKLRFSARHFEVMAAVNTVSGLQPDSDNSYITFLWTFFISVCSAQWNDTKDNFISCEIWYSRFVFWDMAPCSLVNIYRNFNWHSCLNLPRSWGIKFLRHLSTFWPYYATSRSARQESSILVQFNSDFAASFRAMQVDTWKPNGYLCTIKWDLREL